MKAVSVACALVAATLWTMPIQAHHSFGGTYDVSKTMTIKGKMVQVVGGRDLRPLYSCIKLKETWLGETQVVPVRGTARDAGAMPIARAGIADLLNF